MPVSTMPPLRELAPQPIVSGFENCDFCALLRKRARRRETSKSSTDDRNVGGLRQRSGCTCGHAHRIEPIIAFADIHGQPRIGSARMRFFVAE